MRLARRLPPLRPLAGLGFHLWGRWGYVASAAGQPDPPLPKWLQQRRDIRFQPRLRREVQRPRALGCTEKPLEILFSIAGQSGAKSTSFARREIRSYFPTGCDTL